MVSAEDAAGKLIVQGWPNRTYRASGSSGAMLQNGSGTFVIAARLLTLRSNSWPNQILPRGILEHEDKFEASLTVESRCRMLVEAVTDYAIYMLNPAGIVISWNPGASCFKGYEESEILGEHFSRFYTDEDRKQDLPKKALEVAAREGTLESEGWRVRKDGSRFWAYVIIDPIRDNNGVLHWPWSAHGARHG
jgi:PAS domain S-box-containing protein